MPSTDIEYLRRAAISLYLCVDENIAKDLSPRIIQAAEEIEQLRTSLEEVREVLKKHQYHKLVEDGMAGDAFCFALDGVVL